MVEKSVTINLNELEYLHPDIYHLRFNDENWNKDCSLYQHTLNLPYSAVEIIAIEKRLKQLLTNTGKKNLNHADFSLQRQIDTLLYLSTLIKRQSNHTKKTYTSYKNQQKKENLKKLIELEKMIGQINDGDSITVEIKHGDNKVNLELPTVSKTKKLYEEIYYAVFNHLKFCAMGDNSQLWTVLNENKELVTPAYLETQFQQLVSLSKESLFDKSLAFNATLLHKYISSLPQFRTDKALKTFPKANKLFILDYLNLFGYFSPKGKIELEPGYSDFLSFEKKLDRELKLTKGKF